MLQYKATHAIVHGDKLTPVMLIGEGLYTQEDFDLAGGEPDGDLKWVIYSLRGGKLHQWGSPATSELVLKKVRDFD